MILDNLVNAHRYAGVHPRIAQAFEYLARIDLMRIADGRHIIDGDDLFVIVQEYETRPLCEGRWEAHRKYTDIQLVVGGQEQIGYTSLEQVREVEPFSAERDIAFFKGDGQFSRVTAFMFMILMPHDVHMPQIAVGRPERVRKLVVKAALDRSRCIVP